VNSPERLVAVIPARGGSTRIPRKNIVDFHGRPLIAWTIDAALESGIFQDVVVSTDDEEIAAVSRAYGASVPGLRTDAADDHSPVSDATIATLLGMASGGNEFDVVFQLFPVCPLRTDQDIVDAHEFFRGSDADFVLSCYAFNWMNPWWAFTKDEHGIGEKLFPGPTKRSQDLRTLYGPTGAIWIARTAALVEAGTFYGPGHKFWEIDWRHGVDIDDADDLDFAATLFALTDRSAETAG